MSLARLCCLVLFLAFAGQASAERQPAPMFNFKDIPVATTMTAARVKVAIVRGILTQSWEVVQEADGSLLASTIKGGEQHLKVRITYDATKYSLVYVDSQELNANRTPDYQPGPQMSTAEERQLALYKQDPSTPFAVRTEYVINPLYDLWVRELLASVRRQLVAPQI